MLTIRTYKSCDHSSVLELLRQNIPEYFATTEENDFISYLDSEIEDYFVATLKDQIVGCGGINYKNGNSTGIISWDIVSKEHQGQKIGSELLLHRLKLLKTNTQISTIIVRTSQHVYPFYENHGFILKNTVKDYWEIGFDLYHMEMTNYENI